MFENVIQKIKSLYPRMESIPLHAPVFRSNERKYVNECIDSTFVSSVGAFTNQVEDKLKELCQSNHAVVIVNGTAALHTALLLSDVKPNDEVICQSLTFVATANAISYCMAHPIFVDSDEKTLSLCPKKLEAFLKENTVQENGACKNLKTGRRIKACILMHTLGLPGHIEEIQKICRTYNLEFVEDAAESLGSYYKGKHTGTFGKIGVLSFNGNKIATAGGGGALLLQDEALAKKAKHLTTTAKIPHSWEFSHDAIGFNYRMPNINAALLLGQLEFLSFSIKKKRDIALSYKEYFQETPYQFISELEGTISNYWLSAIRFKTPEEKNEFLKVTNEQKIQTRPLWKPMHMLDIYKSAERTSMEVTERLYNTIVCLPSGVPND